MVLNLPNFRGWVESKISKDFSPSTRVHRLPKNLGLAGLDGWVKREDGFGPFIAAGKARKYASLIPWLKANDYQSVVVVGSQNSNHVLAAAQLLKEAGVRGFFLLKKGHTPGTNFHLFQLLVNPDQYEIIPRDLWSVSPAKSLGWQISEEKQGRKCLNIPEGAFHPAALPGVATLYFDILRNEAENGLFFEEIWVDAGTGMTAGGLILGAFADGRKRTIHVVSCAAPLSELETQFQTQHQWLRDAGFSLWDHSGSEVKIELHAPPSGASFGGINAALSKEIRLLGMEEGLLSDPLYSAKMFLTARTILEESRPPGPVLFIHNGGAQVLPGFISQMEKFNA